MSISLYRAVPRSSSVSFDAIVREVEPSPRVRRFRRGLRYAVWNEPERLTTDSQDLLYQALNDLSPRIYGLDFTRYWQNRRDGDLFGHLYRFCVFADESGNLVGWSGYQLRRFTGRLCLYFDTAGILPEWQGAGVVTDLESRAAVRELLTHPWESLYLVTRTPNPRLYRSFRAAVGPEHVYPASGHQPPATIKAIARAVAESNGQAHRMQLDQLKFVDAYLPHLTRLYAERPRSGDPEIDRWFDASLGPCDAFLIVAEARLSKLAAYRLRKIWRRIGGRWSKSQSRNPGSLPT